MLMLVHLFAAVWCLLVAIAAVPVEFDINIAAQQQQKQQQQKEPVKQQNRVKHLYNDVAAQPKWAKHQGLVGHHASGNRGILDCSASQPWHVSKPVDAAHERALSQSFQLYLQSRQYNCTADTLLIQYIHDYGIGSAVNEGALWLLKAFSVDHIYRPTDKWLWAARSAKQCTAHYRSLDCFYDSISPCGTGVARAAGKVAVQMLISEAHEATAAATVEAAAAAETASAVVFTPPQHSAVTGCQLAAAAQRPPEWVFHQVCVQQALTTFVSNRCTVNAKRLALTELRAIDCKSSNSSLSLLADTAGYCYLRIYTAWYTMYNFVNQCDLPLVGAPNVRMMSYILVMKLLHGYIHTRHKQTLQYIQRLSPSTQSFVNARVTAALGNDSTNGSTIAVHVRGGKLDRKLCSNCNMLLLSYCTIYNSYCRVTCGIS
jgi:hypothetical protein